MNKERKIFHYITPEFIKLRFRFGSVMIRTEQTITVYRDSGFTELSAVTFQSLSDFQSWASRIDPNDPEIHAAIWKQLKDRYREATEGKETDETQYIQGQL